MQKEIGQIIMRLRREAGMSQDKLAEMIGVSRESIYRWESGACLPGIKLLKKLAQALQVDEEIFFQDKNGVMIETEEMASSSAIPESAAVSELRETAVSESRESLIETLEENCPQEMPQEYFIACKSDSKLKRVAFWVAITLAILAVVAITAVVILMFAVPADGDGHAQSITWGLSSVDIIVLTAIGAVLALTMIVFAVVRFLKKQSNIKNHNE